MCPKIEGECEFQEWSTVVDYSRCGHAASLWDRGVVEVYHWKDLERYSTAWVLSTVMIAVTCFQDRSWEWRCPIIARSAVHYHNCEAAASGSDSVSAQNYKAIWIHMDCFRYFCTGCDFKKQLLLVCDWSICKRRAWGTTPLRWGRNAVHHSCLLYVLHYHHWC